MAALPLTAAINQRVRDRLECANTGPLSTPPTKDWVLVFVWICVNIPQLEFNKNDPLKFTWCFT